MVDGQQLRARERVDPLIHSHPESTTTSDQSLSFIIARLNGSISNDTPLNLIILHYN
jgi:hypothetical protein